MLREGDAGSVLSGRSPLLALPESCIDAWAELGLGLDSTKCLQLSGCLMKYRIYIRCDFSLIILELSFLVFGLNCGRKTFSFLSPLEILFVLHIKKFFFFFASWHFPHFIFDPFY